jgi:uroporphyrinogen decarboxylase
MNKNFKPDIENLYKVLRRERTDRPVLFEFIIDEAILRKYAQSFQHAEKGIIEYFAMVIDAFKNLGYDYAPLYPWETNTLKFNRAAHDSKASYSQNEGAVITDQSSFEQYTWPNPNCGDFSIYEEIKMYLPDGMKLLACSNGGILENAIEICGFENLCLMYMLEPELTHEIFENIGKRLFEYYKIVSAFDSVGVCVVNDDWGFKTQTIFPPGMMRNYVFPWTKRIIEVIHEAGQPVILHSCGNLEIIMDEIIDDLKIDAKHSFEDGIKPIENAYDAWHDRIALMGGIDVDFLCTKTLAEIRERTLKLLEKTIDSGGYALGSGNSITSYVPEQNYLAMLSAAAEYC